MKVPVYILSGGRSRRFGSDKARAMVSGVTQILRVAELAAPVATRVTVVASRDGTYDDLGLRTIGDRVPGQGPIGGLATAIDDAAEVDGRGDDTAEGLAWLLAIACDWVGLRRRWLDALLEKIPEGTHVICYKTDRYEPLLALYHVSVADTLAAQVAAGKLAMHDLLARLHVLALPRPDGWDTVTNLNTPPAA